MKKSKKDTPVTDWRQVQQNSSRAKQPLTVQAMKRKLYSWCRVLLVLFVFLVLASAIAFLIINNTGTIDKTEVLPSGHKIEEVSFNTDGCLDRAWFEDNFSQWMNEDLMHLDLLKLKKDIEEAGQVASADVSRNLPGELILDLKEQKPIMKVKLLDKGFALTYLVSKTGAIYRGENYDPEWMKKLPFLGGTVLKRSASGKVLPLKDVDIVSTLLGRANDSYPELFNTWRIVNLKKFKEDPMALDSLIIVNSAYVKEIIFAPSKFDLQLSRLNEIIMKAKKAGESHIERIDVSFADQAFVTMPK